MLAAGLVGCAPDPEDYVRQPSASASPSATEAASTPAPTKSPIGLGVIASGQFAGIDGGISGTVEVSARAGSRTTFAISDLTGAPKDAEVLLLPGSQSSSICADDDAVNYGPVSYVPDGSDRPLDTTKPFEDPTIWHRIVLAVPGGDASECTLEIVAEATLDWQAESPRAYLADIVDGGAEPGATGGVTLADGKVYAYKVAPGDILSIVADRFGVKPSDIQRLNPFRDDPLSEDLYADEILNLSLELR